jgi:heterotetrameric sarcosine oxidase gamma subunit
MPTTYALGAVWMPAGNWRRPEYYSLGGATRAACIAAEVQAVRSGVGVIDVGTLGKIEAHGPLAADFLNRVYTGRFDNLKVGMTRYALMLDESAVVIDDGVVARLADEVFYFTTTTGNSAAIFRELGRLATWWGMAVPLVNLTGHLAAFNLAGPRAREVLAKLTALDLSPAAFPYLGAREAMVAGVPARLLRVGFVGELGYEIHVPAQAGATFWRALLEAGREAAIRPFGVEAQRRLRLEKGHIIVGQDTDGVTNPLELGVDWALKLDKPFFIGQRSLRILAQQPARQTLVGFSMVGEPAATIRECHLVIEDGEIAGRVTSVSRSATLERLIGLALVQPAVARRKQFTIRADRGVPVTVDSRLAAVLRRRGRAPGHRRPRADAAGRGSGMNAAMRSAEPLVTLRDVSRRARLGCKGAAAEAFLMASSLPVPAAANSWVVDDSGHLVARLATAEFLVEATGQQAHVTTLATRLAIRRDANAVSFPCCGRTACSSSQDRRRMTCSGRPATSTSRRSRRATTPAPARSC